MKKSGFVLFISLWVWIGALNAQAESVGLPGYWHVTQPALDVSLENFIYRFCDQSSDYKKCHRRLKRMKQNRVYSIIFESSLKATTPNTRYICPLNRATFRLTNVVTQAVQEVSFDVCQEEASIHFEIDDQDMSKYRFSFLLSYEADHGVSFWIRGLRLLIKE